MSLSDVLVLGIAVIGGAAALLVVTARNVVHAALFLVAALLSVAATFLVVGAEFLAWAQVLVYVGAVVVLILFGLMLTRAPIGPMAQHNENRRLAFGVSLTLFLFLTTLVMISFGDVTIALDPTPTVALGEVLYVEWAFPLMVLGFLLTVALIGAIIIARREVGEGPEPVVQADTGEVQPAPVPSDASSQPGVTRPSEEEEVGT